MGGKARKKRESENEVERDQEASPLPCLDGKSIFFSLILFAFFSCFYLLLKCLLLYRGGKGGEKLGEGNLENGMCVLYVCFAYDLL